MKTLQLKRVEDILEVSKETECIAIEQEHVLYFLYNNSQKLNQNSKINISEVRKKYINSLRKFYNSNDYTETSEEIIFDANDIQNLKCKNF